MAMVLQQTSLTTLADDGTTLAAETAVTESVTEVEGSTEDNSNNTSNETTTAEDSSTGTTEAVSTEASAQTTEATATEATTATETSASSDNNAALDTPIEETATTSDETADESEEITESMTEAATDAEAESESEAETEEATEAATEVEEMTEASENAEATEMETEEATEAETESEAPKTSFTYSDSRVVITATATEEANFPQDAELKADYIEPGSDAYKAAVAVFDAQLSTELGADDENVVVEYTLYDIYFLCTSTGERIEPEEGKVTVTMTFVTPIATETDGEVVSTEVVHLKNDGEAEIVTDYVDTNSDGEVTSMGFTSDSFSIFGSGSGIMPVEEVGTSSSTSIDSYITSVTIYNSNGTVYDPTTTELDRDGTYKITINFSETIGGLQFPDNGIMTYQMPSVINIEAVTNADLYGYIDGNYVKVGTYSIDSNGLITFYLDTTYVTTYTNLSVSAEFNASFDATEIGKDSSTTIKFTDEISKVINFEAAEEVQIKKSVSNTAPSSANDEVTYTIEVTATTDATNVIVTDTMSDALTLTSGFTYTLNGSTVSSYTYSQSGNTYTFSLGNLNAGDVVIITYTAKLSDSELQSLNGSKDVYNGVTAVSDYSDKVSTGETVTFSHELLSKEAEYETIGGTKYLKWTVTFDASYLSSLKGYSISDALAASGITGYTLYDAKGLSISVGGGTSTIYSGSKLSWDSTNGTWTYTFDENDALTTYVFTYYTTVPTNSSNYDIELANTAVLNKDSTEITEVTESEYVEGAGLPHDAVEKTGELVSEDTTDGTTYYVKWTVTVNVPANTEYKGVVLTDIPSDAYYLNGYDKQILLFDHDNPDLISTLTPSYTQLGRL